MATTTEITKVTCRWDDQPGVQPGWYCETWIGDTLVDDSQKVWFPVNVDDYGRDETAELKSALREGFPEAEIVIQ
jgi:hypothetical protein